MIQKRESHDNSWQAWLQARARTHGFADSAIGALSIAPHGKALERFVALGFHGDMEWMGKSFLLRADPRAMWKEAKTVVILADSYAPEKPHTRPEGRQDAPAISIYAQGADYHRAMKRRLRPLAEALVARARAQGVAGPRARLFVDTAPLMEKPLAERAGLGWIGKHTNLVSRRLGSWFFLGVILVDFDLPIATPHPNRCGRCRRCLDACPTAAFPAPYQLDARRCIAYLTIEHKGVIPRTMRPFIGGRIFGCDDCLAVCPWNKFARPPAPNLYAACDGRDAPDLQKLAALDDAAFRERFARSPIRRTGRARFVRNVMIAIGNAGDRALAPSVQAVLGDESPLVTGAAIWALSRLLSARSFARLAQRWEAAHDDATLAEEWRLGLREALSAGKEA